jgi:hypothetical protein
MRWLSLALKIERDSTKSMANRQCFDQHELINTRLCMEEMIAGRYIPSIMMEILDTFFMALIQKVCTVNQSQDRRY